MHRLPFDCLFGAHLSFESPFSHFAFFMHLTSFILKSKRALSAHKSHFASYSFAHNILLLLVFVCDKERWKEYRTKTPNQPFSVQHLSYGNVLKCRLYEMNFENLEIMHISIKNEIESELHKAHRSTKLMNKMPIDKSRSNAMRYAAMRCDVMRFDVMRRDEMRQQSNYSIHQTEQKKRARKRATIYMKKIREN